MEGEKLAMSPGTRSGFPSAYRSSSIRLRPTSYPKSASPLRRPALLTWVPRDPVEDVTKAWHG